MHVGIDEPRENGSFAEIMDLATVGRYLIGRNNRPDLFSFHQDGRWPDSFRSDYAAREEGLQTQNVRSLDWGLEAERTRAPPLLQCTLHRNQTTFTNF
jgi:hypothetical protein